jgi:DNA-binding winged helix-turn-helix (wHTH) protein/tetratricopeptide (TPR) repeat protein
VNTQPSPAQHLVFGPYRFDRRAGDLYRGDNVVPLQPQSLQLLRCLLERPGEVVSRTELRARLWPPHTVVDFEVGLNAAIKKLRTALTDSPASPHYIETVARRGYRFIGIRKASSTCQAIDTLAVLPFSLKGGGSRMKHLGEALAERLIHALSAVPGIGKVIARDAAFKHASSEPAEIGRVLGVRAVLTGHLTITRRLARLTAELIDTAGATHLWGTILERPLSELSQLQVELADEVCAALRASLPGQGPQGQLGGVHRFDVYRLYLQGRYAFGKRTLSATNEAIGLYEKAIQGDDRFALAHAGLADCYNSLSSWEMGSLAPGIGFEKARLAALRALQLDPQSAEAHTSIAFSHLHYSWEWDLAEREFKRALSLNPRYPHARHWYSHLLGALGRTAESLQESQTLIELDPFDLVTNVHMCWHHYMAREFAPALREAQRTLEMEKRWAWGYFFTGLSLNGLGEYRDAVKKFRKAWELSGRQNFVAFSALGHAYGSAGMYDSARDVLRRLQELTKSRYISSYEIALIHLGLGEQDLALERLHKAVEERSGWLPYMANDVRLDPLRSSAQFVSVQARVGLPSHA